jgi:hypothetical protein
MALDTRGTFGHFVVHDTEQKRFAIGQSLGRLDGAKFWNHHATGYTSNVREWNGTALVCPPCFVRNHCRAWERQAHIINFNINSALEVGSSTSEVKDDSCGGSTAKGIANPLCTAAFAFIVRAPRICAA